MLDTEASSSSLANFDSCTYDKPYESPLIIKSCEFSEVVQKLREFFVKKGYVEVHTQNRLSILAACEDPTTMATYNYAGNVWPLPQTGQMWLEHYLLDNPEVPEQLTPFLTAILIGLLILFASTILSVIL